MHISWLAIRLAKHRIGIGCLPLFGKSMWMSILFDFGFGVGDSNNVPTYKEALENGTVHLVGTNHEVRLASASCRP